MGDDGNHSRVSTRNTVASKVPFDLAPDLGKEHAELLRGELFLQADTR